MSGNLFAILLLLFPPATAVVVFFLGQKPTRKTVLVAFVFGVLFSFGLVYMTPMHFCDKGGTQAATLVSVACSSVFIVYLRKKTRVIPIVIATLIAGQVMQEYAISIVHREGYIGRTDWPYIGFGNWEEEFHRVPSYSGVRLARALLEKRLQESPDRLLREGWIEEVLKDEVEKESMSRFEKMEGTRVGKFWHTFFTGIHRFERIPYGIWCSSDAAERRLPSLTIRHRSEKDTNEEDMKVLSIDSDPYETAINPMQENWRIGEPMRFRVEIRPKGAETAYGEDAPDRFLVIGPNGEKAPRISECLGNQGSLLSRGENGNFVYQSDGDILQDYMISMPGKYSIQFTGHALSRNAHPSNTVFIDVKEGPKPMAYLIAEKVIQSIPYGWILSFDYTQATVRVHGSEDVRGSMIRVYDDFPGMFACVEIYALEKKAPPKSNWTETPEYLGYKGGFHYYRVEFGDRKDKWPGCSELVRQAIGADPNGKR